MRGFVLGLVTAAVIFAVASTWLGRPTPQAAGFPPMVESSPTPILPTPSPSLVAATGCDGTEELFARMFVGLTQAVLTESGKTPEEFAAAVAADREILRRYFEVLGIPVEEAWLDSVMSPDLDQRLLSGCLEP